METNGRRRGEGQTALITGASMGIGLELAKLFARDGFNLVLVARSQDKLEALAAELRKTHSVRVVPVKKDLAQPGAPDELIAELIQAGLSIDVLVNNAGFAVYGEFVQSDLEKELELLQLNIQTLTHLTKLCLRFMKEKGRGRILNVASIAAFQPGPLMSVYYASKAYVLSFSEAIACELRGTGITVTALCPGMTRSEFQKTAGIHGIKLTGNFFMMDSDRVAREGYQALMQGKAVVIPGFKNNVMAQSVRVAPRALVPEIVRFLQSQK